MEQWGFDAVEAHNMQLRNTAFAALVEVTKTIKGLTVSF